MVINRGAHSTDPAVLAAVQEEASVAALAHIFPPHRYPFPRQQVLESWETFTGEVLVAQVDGKIVGCCALSPPWLQSLYVLPSHWGKGVASRLLNEAVTIIKQSGAKQAHLWALEHNGRARAFYAKHGWALDGTSRVVEFPPHPTDVGYTLRL